MSFPVSFNTISKKITPYQRPVEIACFSFDGARKLHHDDRSMTYYCPANVDNQLERELDTGYPNSFVERKERVPEYIHSLLESIQILRNKIVRETDKVHHDLDDVQFCTWRGIITRICTAPYDNDEWTFYAARYRDTIYIVEAPKTDELPREDRLHRFMYWGYRFETVSTVPVHPSKVTDEILKTRCYEEVNTNVQYCSVVRTRLGKNAIIMGAEVDCTTDDKAPNDPTRNYVELKTSRVISNERQQRNFEKFKLLRIYIQSFLVAVPRIIIGFRDDDGVIQEIKEFETLKIPRIVRQKGYWDPNICLSFCDSFLEYTRSVVQEEMATYKLEFQKPFRSIQITRFPDVNASDFVPDWFRDM